MEIIEARDPVAMNGFTRRRRQGIGGRKLALDMMPEDRVAFRLMLEASQGHGMASIRDWLQKRFNSLDLVHASKSAIEADKNKSDCLASAVVITPKNIPDFVIPSNPHRKRLVKQSKSVCSPSSVSLKEDNLESSRFQKLKSSISEGRMFTKNTSLRQGRTRAQSDQSSYKSQHLREQQIDIIVDSQSDDGHTTEPDTRIANRSLHLPHLTAVTSYGFPTLLESPHTRRKESLLLGSASADDIHKLACKKNTLPSMHRSQSGSPFDDISTGPYTDSLLVPGVYSLNNSTMSLSNNSSPSDSPISIRSYYRRRSSAPSLTSDEESVDEASFQGRFSQPSSQEVELLGELKLSLTFNKSDSTLRVLLIKAENLIHNISDRAQLSMFVKLDVTGKNKKYESSSVKGTSNPIFNEEITLTNITQDTLDNCTLRLRVCNQLSLRRYHTIGEVLLPLHALSLEQGEEVRMWRDLQPKSSNQNPGVINVSAKFSPKQDNLSITVIEAQNLHKSQLLAGFPDTYVKVIVEQEGTGTIKKHTRVRKNTTHPVFKETFVFCVSPKVELIRYTSVTIQLMSRGHLMHDTVLGEMRLGQQSVTDDAQLHWTNIMQNVDKDIQQWHYLSPLNKTG